ncbi:TPA: hypothetical protein ACH9TR_005065 [Escherichia coli]
MAAKKDDIMNSEIVAGDTATENIDMAEENTVDNAEAAEEKTGVQLSCGGAWRTRY